MLADESCAADFEMLLMQCERALQIPREYYERIQGRHPGRTCEQENRRYARRLFVETAVLELKSTLPALPRDISLHEITCVDISRTGIGFLHARQLFPCELMHIHFSLGKTFEAQVAACRKIAANCYHIGALFIRNVT